VNLADVFLRDRAQSTNGFVGERIPGEERNHVRHEGRCDSIGGAEHTNDADTIRTIGAR
jgi:hypothetical protein